MRIRLALTVAVLAASSGCASSARPARHQASAEPVGEPPIPLFSITAPPAETSAHEPPSAFGLAGAGEMEFRILERRPANVLLENSVLSISQEEQRVLHGLRGSASILGAAAAADQVLVWWRLDANRTELASIDPDTARVSWRRPGPIWAWDAQMVSHGGHVALLADHVVTVFETSAGRPAGRFALADVSSDVGWSHPLALGAGMLVVGTPSSVVVADPATGAQRVLSAGLGGSLLPSLVAADDDSAYAVFGQDLVAFGIAEGERKWVVRVAHAASLYVTGRHLIHCDADDGATVIDKATGRALLRIGTGRCSGAREQADGTIAIAGRHNTWLVGPRSPTLPEVTDAAHVIEGMVTLDGGTASGIPVLLGTMSVPLDGLDGCPPLPPYVSCVVTDGRGRFRASVRAHGWLPVTVDLDAAARRLGRPRARGGMTELDLEAAALPVLRLEVEGADEEL